MDLPMNFKILNTYFNIIFNSTTYSYIAKGIHWFFVCLQILYETSLCKGILRLEKSAYLLNTQRSTVFSILFTLLLIFVAKK